MKDFPHDALASYGIAAQSPDDFVANLIDLAPDVICDAAKLHRTSLKRPAMTVDEYLASLERQKLPASVAKLRANADLL